MIAVKKVLGIGLITLSALSLSGCGLTPLPDEERYSKVNAVKDQLDFENAGKVISEEYSGDGVWSGSSYTVEIEGEYSFEDFSDQLKNISPYDRECVFSEAKVQCIFTNPSIELIKDNTEVVLKIKDAFGGRDEK